MLAYVLIKIIFSSVLALIIIRILQAPLRSILEELTSKKFADPLLHLTSWGIWIIALIAGSGFIVQNYQGSFNLQIPTDAASAFFSIYNSLLAILISVGLPIALLVFISIGHHFRLSLARISAAQEKV